MTVLFHSGFWEGGVSKLRDKDISDINIIVDHIHNEDFGYLGSLLPGVPKIKELYTNKY